MPLTRHGKKIHDEMIKRYGHKKGKQVFYATANDKSSGGGVGHIGGKRVHKATLDEWIKENGNE